MKMFGLKVVQSTWLMWLFNSVFEPENTHVYGVLSHWSRNRQETGGPLLRGFKGHQFKFNLVVGLGPISTYPENFISMCLQLFVRLASIK